MNAVNDPDIAAVAETLLLAQDAILSDSKQLAGQFVARLYEVSATNTSLANCIDQPRSHCSSNTSALILHFVNVSEIFCSQSFLFFPKVAYAVHIKRFALGVILKQR